MTALIAVLSLLLIAIIIIQISRITELADRIRGEKEAFQRNNRITGNLLLGFLGLFLLGALVCAYIYHNYLLGFGPHESASEHGVGMDSIFLTTTIICGIVFVITHIALFYFAWKYQSRPGKKAMFISHDNRLEIVWTIIPAITMFILVISGLVVWNEVMADVEEGEEVIEIEATGMQFAWMIRYAGEDGVLGERDFKRINGANPLGQVWEDKYNHDDTRPSEIVLPVGKKVRVRITARDVLHNFDLPHFRVKMDAVPGMPTYFVFTPTRTTEQYREELSKYKEYQVPSDPSDPDSAPLWEVFNYELACAELCGTGHFSMRTLVRIVEQDEYESWLTEQTSYYETTIKGTIEDPFTDPSEAEVIETEAEVEPVDGETNPVEGETETKADIDGSPVEIETKDEN